MAVNLAHPMNLYLRGELGSGKTTLVRGLLRGLGVIGAIKSPTYALLETYQVSHPVVSNIYHFDLYRLRDENEWHSLGFVDYFCPQNLCLVEWADRASNILPSADLNITLSIWGLGRRAVLSAHNDIGQQLMQALV